MDAYMKLTIEGNVILGPVTSPSAAQNTVRILAVDHEISTAQAGRVAGKVQDRPFVITKAIDQTSPLLYKALLNKESVENCEIMYFGPAAGGTTGSTHLMTVKLEKVHVSAIKHELLNVCYPENAKHPARERVAFTYRIISWLWQANGAEHTHSLERP